MGYCKAPADRLVPLGQVPAAFPLTVKGTEPRLKGNTCVVHPVSRKLGAYHDPAEFSGSFLLIAQSVLRAAFPVLSICLAIMLSSSCVIVAQFATR